jgi:hypothetical protein
MIQAALFACTFTHAIQSHLSLSIPLFMKDLVKQSSFSVSETVYINVCIWDLQKKKNILPKQNLLVVS